MRQSKAACFVWANLSAVQFLPRHMNCFQTQINDIGVKRCGNFNSAIQVLWIIGQYNMCKNIGL